MLDCIHLHLIYYCVSFCMFRTNFPSINLLKPSQLVLLLEVSSDSKLSWSVRSIENAINTHEYLNRDLSIGTTRTQRFNSWIKSRVILI